MRLIDADLIQYEPMLSAKGNGMYEDVMVAYKSQIDDLPTIEERKKGKWINHRNDMGHNIADCSECGEAMQWYDPDTRPNYCPSCGARMEGEQK